MTVTDLLNSVLVISKGNFSNYYYLSPYDPDNNIAYCLRASQFATNFNGKFCSALVDVNGNHFNSKPFLENL